MEPDPISDAPRSVVSVWPPLVILAFAVAILGWSQVYSATAARFPTAVGAILAVLAVIDLWSRLPLPGQTLIAGFWGTSFARREMRHVPPLREEAVMVLWILAAFAGVALAGVLVALPLFCVAFIRFRAKRSFALAIAVALGLGLFEWAVFEGLLDYELYRGLLFSNGGLARW